MNCLLRRWRRRQKSSAFSLLEVLVALALVSMVFGSIIGGFCRHVHRVARLEPFYRNLIAASVGLEKSMAKRNEGETDSVNEIEYTVTVGSVPSDPRIDQIISKSSDSRPGCSAEVRAYRLRQVSSKYSSSSSDSL
ncbi:MAG: prepilin-type N-terminal cleavage/methylation domain-containing protein [Candidatus Bruticola sp.]